MGDFQEGIAEAASILSVSDRVCASCGAGVSAESGIPTFRDPGGIWDRVNPMEIGTAQGLVHALTSKGKTFLPLIIDVLNTFEKASPNPGHVALAEFEKMGFLKTIITQNIDNLQQEAGTENIIEVHGNLFKMICTACKKKKKFNRISLLSDLREKLVSIKNFTPEVLASHLPACGKCGGLMRPDVVMFGEPVHGISMAFDEAARCDTMLVLGTSGVVYPAAALPAEAKKSGARIIVVNPNENAFTSLADVYIPMKTGEALPEIRKRIHPH